MSQLPPFFGGHPRMVQSIEDGQLEVGHAPLSLQGEERAVGPHGNHGDARKVPARLGMDDDEGAATRKLRQIGTGLST